MHIWYWPRLRSGIRLHESGMITLCCCRVLNWFCLMRYIWLVSRNVVRVWRVWLVVWKLSRGPYGVVGCWLIWKLLLRGMWSKGCIPCFLLSIVFRTHIILLACLQCDCIAFSYKNTTPEALKSNMRIGKKQIKLLHLHMESCFLLETHPCILNSFNVFQSLSRQRFPILTS